MSILAYKMIAKQKCGPEVAAEESRQLHKWHYSLYTSDNIMTIISTLWMVPFKYRFLLCWRVENGGNS
jgi:hypothetical protein